MRSTLRSVVAAFFAAQVVSCAAIWGLEELPVGTGTAPEAGLDGGPDDGPQEATGADGGGGCTCVAAAPDGWTGPVELYEGTSAAAQPSCAAPYDSPALMGNANLAPSVASCAACVCGPAQGGKCGAHLTFFHNPCGQTLGGCNQEDYGLVEGACQPLATAGGTCAGAPVESFQVDYAEVAAGSCAPSGGDPTGGAPSWGTVAVACGPVTPFAQGTCAPTDVCVPPQGASFPNVCLQRAGAQSCAGLPSGYQTAHVVYTSFDDTRTCSPCSCGQPTPTCTLGGTASFFTDSACTVAATAPGTRSIGPAAACYSLPGSSYFSTYSPGSSLPGSCQPSGGSATGEVVPSSATTFCCGR